MTFTLQTEEYAMKKGRPVRIRNTPYVRLCLADNPPVFIQHGKFYYENGQELSESDLPEWVSNELAKLSHDARQEVGLGTTSTPSRRKS